jgi:hypothetical protein
MVSVYTPKLEIVLSKDKDRCEICKFYSQFFDYFYCKRYKRAVRKDNYCKNFNGKLDNFFSKLLELLIVTANIIDYTNKGYNPLEKRKEGRIIYI